MTAITNTVYSQYTEAVGNPIPRRRIDMRQTLTNLRMLTTGMSEMNNENLKAVLDEIFRALKELDERLEASEKKIRSGY